MIPILDLTKQYEQIQAEVEKTVLEVLKSGQYICGKHNKALQEEMAAFCGAKRAIAMNSGTDALHLALRALDIGAGDEVITIYEATGRVVPPGSIPISVGVTVFNVETALNIYNALYYLQWPR